MVHDFPITHETSDPEGLSNQILAEVLRYNASQAGPLNDSRYVLTIRSDAGELIAGLVGIRYWNGLYIDLLWVREGFRRHGLGARLMRQAENDLRRNSGEIIFLSTWSFQAPGFYEKLGYSAFGVLDGMPAGTTRTWFVKRLGQTQPS